jgi:hypothetical protein
MLNDPQYAMRMSMKPRWSPGYNYIKAIAVAVLGTDFMTEADALGEMVVGPLNNLTYAAAVEVPWFLTFWTMLLAFFFAGIFLGNIQGCLCRACLRFIKRGLGYDDYGGAGPLAPLRTVGVQSMTNYDRSMTRYDTMRFVAQNQGFQRAGEVEVIFH